MSDKCAYCENVNGLEWHHIWPLSLGGPDEPYNMIRVCHDHHGFLHSMHARGNISELTKEGIRKSKESGTVLGAPLKINPQDLAHMIELREAGATYDDLAQKFTASKMTINRTVNRWMDNISGYEELYLKQQRQYANG